MPPRFLRQPSSKSFPHSNRPPLQDGTSPSCTLPFPIQPPLHGGSDRATRSSPLMINPLKSLFSRDRNGCFTPFSLKDHPRSPPSPKFFLTFRTARRIINVDIRRASWIVYRCARMRRIRRIQGFDPARWTRVRPLVQPPLIIPGTLLEKTVPSASDPPVFLFRAEAPRCRERSTMEHEFLPGIPAVTLTFVYSARSNNVI